MYCKKKHNLYGIPVIHILMRCGVRTGFKVISCSALLKGYFQNGFQNVQIFKKETFILMYSKDH